MQRSTNSTLALGLLVVLLTLVQGCGDSTSPPKPSRIIITPFSETLDALGETVQYSARLEDRKGNEIPDATFTWSVTDPQVASISSSGLLTGLQAGSAKVQAETEGITASANLTVDPLPEELTKTAGDQQLGTLRQILPVLPTVEVLDANQNPVQGKNVSFVVTAGGGTATPSQAQTGPDGKASTTWQLGCSNENPQRLEARIGGLTVSFSAQVDLAALAICKDSVPDGRVTLSYATTLEAAGGDPGTLTWSVVGGSQALPPGIELQPGGELSGIPTQAGLFTFTARVQDALGGSTSAPFALRVCQAPIVMAPGESLTFPPTTVPECGFFLPAGEDGDRYRFGVFYARPDDNAPEDVPTVTVKMEREVGGFPASASLLSARADVLGLPSPSADPDRRDLPGLDEAAAIAARTEALHHRIRLAERELLRSLGPAARPLPDTRNLLRAAGPSRVSPDKVSFTNSSDFSSCSVSETVKAIKIAENDDMVIYQDSTQWASDPLADGLAQPILEFYAAYGPPVIEGHFGGITDINNDGKVVMFVTPVVEDGTAAFVWSGDFLSKSNCLASNEMEIMRFNLDVIQAMNSGNYQAMGTAVHEVKHISSLYKSISRFNTVPGDGFQPLWVEEGTAEIAKEVASRLAWAAAGGPPREAMAGAADVNSFNQANYGAILTLAGTVRYLSSQPNGVVTTPLGAASGHSVYGSGWHFHRWLGDAYGDAAGAQGDAALFRVLNDSLTATGVPGILDVTGAPAWSTLLSEYFTAVMLNGTPAPQGARPFTTYDFPSITGIFSVPDPPGDYPWPVNVFGESGVTAPFATSTNVGSVGSSGVRIFDLTSNGTGLGLEVTVSTDGAGTLSPFRIVLVRIE